MTVTIPSLPRRQVNWWVISAGIVMVGYACIAGVVFVLWGAVGFFIPGIDYQRLRSRFPCSSLGQHHLSVREWDESKQMRELVSRRPRGPRSGAGVVGREVLASEGGAGGDEVGGCTFEDDPAAVVAGAGAEVDDPVGVRHDRLVVLDDDDRLAGVHEPVE